jgi:hypothetical protein
MTRQQKRGSLWICESFHPSDTRDTRPSVAGSGTGTTWRLRSQQVRRIAARDHRAGNGWTSKRLVGYGPRSRFSTDSFVLQTFAVPSNCSKDLGSPRVPNGPPNAIACQWPDRMPPTIKDARDNAIKPITPNYYLYYQQYRTSPLRDISFGDANTKPRPKLTRRITTSRLNERSSLRPSNRG